MSQVYFPDVHDRIMDYDQAVTIDKTLSDGDAREILQENIFTCKKVIAFYDKYFLPPYSEYLKVYTDCSIFQITTILVQEMMGTPALRIAVINKAKEDHNVIVLAVLRAYSPYSQKKRPFFLKEK